MLRIGFDFRQTKGGHIEISLLRIFNIKEANDFIIELDNIIKSVFGNIVFILKVERYYCDI